MGRFHTISDETIYDGAATDAYFERTEEALDHAGRNPHVVAEVTADQFPTGGFEVLAGVEDAAKLLEGLSVDVEAMREGMLFDGGPVMRIEGQYRDFARYETALLGFLSHASGMATNALDVRRAAPDSKVFSFGARHVHPSIAAVVERSALLAGLDGFSHVAAGEVLDREPSGTMPHALMLSFDMDKRSAWRAFDEGVDESVPRIALCDTETDERHEVLAAVDELGDDLDGVRLDTTGSRRGDFRHIIREVQWALEEVGRDDVDVFVSGGLGPDDLRELRDVADGFGVGGYISNADPVDFSLDIVRIEDEPISKRGKLSGVKEVYRDGAEHRIVPEHKSRPVGNNIRTLIQPLIEDGDIVREFDLDGAAKRAQTDANRVGFRTTTNQE